MRVVGVIALAALLGAPLRAQDTTATRDSLPSSGVIDTAAFRDLAVPDPRQLRTLQPRVVEPASWSVVIDSARFHDLPSTDPRQVIDLQRGVMETSSPKGVSLRGSAPGEAATYIDGALIRNGQRGEADLVLGANAIHQAWLTTGGLAADVGDAASGAVSFLTRTGSERWRGSLHYRTDDVAFDAWGNVGLHRVEASIGGPVGGGLTLFTAVTLNGQQSLDTEKNRDVQAPVYVVGGIDTIVHQPERWGVDPTDSAFVAIPRFVQYGGGCDAAGNDGVDCQGLRVPLTANGSLAWQGRIQESYGRGSLVGLTGLASRAQQRDYPGVSLYNPSNYTGTSAANTAAILNWRQVLGPWTERAPILSVNVSYQRDTRISGPLTRQADLDSRSPFGGFLLKPLDYVVNPTSTYSVRIQDSVYADVRYLDDRQLQCVQAGEGACRHPVAYLNDNALNSVMPYRMNPYGVEQSTSFPLWTAGADNGRVLAREARWQCRAELAWQVGAFTGWMRTTRGRSSGAPTWRIASTWAAPRSWSACATIITIHGPTSPSRPVALRRSRSCRRIAFARRLERALWSPVPPRPSTRTNRPRAICGLPRTRHGVRECRRRSEPRRRHSSACPTVSRYRCRTSTSSLPTRTPT